MNWTTYSDGEGNSLQVDILGDNITLSFYDGEKKISELILNDDDAKALINQLTFYVS